MNKLNVVRLDPSYSEQIQNIWVESLPNNLKSIIGKYIMHKYISLFFENKHSLGIGLINEQKLVGFVMYGNDKTIIKELIERNIFKILKTFLTSIIKLEIRKIFNYINCFFFIFFSRTIEKKLRLSHIELLIICVSHVNQGKKYGSFLIQESIKNYQNYFKNYNGIFVKTLKKDSQNISFYEKNNFDVIDEVFSRVYLKYIN
jgi:hypothetical protein